MLYSTKELQGYTVNTADGDKGKIKDFHFHEQTWDIVDIVLDMGGWLIEHNVSVTPDAVRDVDVANKSIEIALRKSDLDEDQMVTPEAGPASAEGHTGTADPALHNTNEVAGYPIYTGDAELGHVDSFIIDSQEWVLRYFVINTRSLLPGKHVLVAREWIRQVSWEETRLYTDLSATAIQNAPDYDPSQPVQREYEEQLYKHYGKAPYWASQQAQ